MHDFKQSVHKHLLRVPYHSAPPASILNIHRASQNGSPRIMMLIYLMKVIHNGSFVHQPQGIMVRAGENKQTSWMWVPDRKKRNKVSQGWEKYVAKCQRDSLLFWVFGWGAGVVSIFLSGLAWHRPQSCPRHNSSYSMGERGRERGRGREMSGWGGVGEVWCLSLPWSPMALLTIQHPPNYPPIHSQRDKASVLVCWSNMATNLSHSNITPTSLSLEVRRAQALHRAPLYFFIRDSTTDDFTELVQGVPFFVVVVVFVSIDRLKPWIRLRCFFFFEDADTKNRWRSPRKQQQVNVSVLNERSGKEYCRSMRLWAVFIFRTGHGASDATRLLHQDHRLTAATERVACLY